MHLLRDTVQLFQKVLGPAHPHTVECVDNLAAALARAGEGGEYAAQMEA